MITAKEIEEFEVWMLEKGYSPYTVKNAVRYLRMLYIRKRMPHGRQGRKCARWALHRYNDFLREVG